MRVSGNKRVSLATQADIEYAGIMSSRGIPVVESKDGKTWKLCDTAKLGNKKTKTFFSPGL